MFLLLYFSKINNLPKPEKSAGAENRLTLFSGEFHSNLGCIALINNSYQLVPYTYKLVYKTTENIVLLYKKNIFLSLSCSSLTGCFLFSKDQNNNLKELQDERKF